MKHLLVPIEIAMKLKALNFNETCFGYYDYTGHLCITDGKWEHPMTTDRLKCSNITFKDYPTTYAAPTHQQVIDWFRSYHRLHLAIYPIRDKWDGDVRKITGDVNQSLVDFDGFSSYYEALNKAIEEALTLIE